ncbi:hypothetical protein E2493_10155 [Sphingomonas parva]|uniref:SH3 domain-containing protein n=1 Tax=Sphingomonas parva TaxID=2555898 RepID=A0A4Y8ZQN4_9SPHN|nr:DUF6491 family protein [Sphingomonas parva]TFI58340.1 hypothetical protein E2493_10155 [Sphingomonas parva]
MKKIVLALAALVVAAPSLAAPGASGHPSEVRQASIPFVNLRGIRDFRAEGRDAVYLQDRARNWYRAELAGPCYGLPFAHAIGVDTRGGNGLDRFGSLIVEGNRCPVLSLIRSAAPEKRPARQG